MPSAPRRWDSLTDELMSSLGSRKSFSRVIENLRHVFRLIHIISSLFLRPRTWKDWQTEIKSATTFAETTTSWVIISDIDDTIKETMASSLVGVLKTFLKEPKPISDMREFYHHLKSRLLDPPFWYVSASPYNLYLFLRNFCTQY